MKKTVRFLTTLFLALVLQTGQGLLTHKENAAFADFSFRDMELSFVQISDSHISDKEDTSYKALSSSKALLEDAIKQTNDIKMLDVVMFTGDMVNEPTKQSYRDFFVLLTKVKHPPLMAFGNHDMTQAQNPDRGAKEYITKDEALNIIKKCNPYYIFDKSYYAFSPKNDYRVIVLDTTVDEAITANGKLTDAQGQFLKEELEAHKDKVIVIFQHHPVVEPFKSEHHKIVNAEDYMEIIKQYKKTPIAIFSGHYHAAKIMRQGNIIHVSTPSLVTYPNAFRYVNITNYKDRTIFNIKYMETNLSEVQKNSKLNAIASATLRGLPNDHSVIITIRKDKTYDNEIKEEKPKTIKEDKELQKEAAKAQKEAAKQDKANKKAEERAAKETAKKEAEEKAAEEKMQNTAKKTEEIEKEQALKAEEAAKKEAERQAEKEAKAQASAQKKAENEAQKEALKIKKEAEKEALRAEKLKKQAEADAKKEAANKAKAEADSAKKEVQKQAKEEAKKLKEAAKAAKKETPKEGSEGNAGN